jgi:hypothetical protein
MATRTTLTLEDDLDGGVADETLRFALGGAEYEIDLSNKNARVFRRQLAPFVEHARKAGSGSRRRPARPASDRARSAAVRAWAREQGITVSERGRIAAGVVERYEAATRARR